MNKAIMKSYHLGFKPQEVEIRDNETMLQTKIKIDFETMAESFAKKKDDEILGFLYDKYKDTDVSDVYVLSEKDFKTFLLEMLPKWKMETLKGSSIKSYAIDEAECSQVIEQALQRKSLAERCWEIVKAKRVSIVYLEDSQDVEQYNEFAFQTNGYASQLTKAEFETLKEGLE